MARNQDWRCAASRPGTAPRGGRVRIKEAELLLQVRQPAPVEVFPARVGVEIALPGDGLAVAAEPMPGDAALRPGRRTRVLLTLESYTPKMIASCDHV